MDSRDTDARLEANMIRALRVAVLDESAVSGCASYVMGRIGGGNELSVRLPWSA